MADSASLRVAIITISDSVSSGKSEDKSGPAVKEHCRQLGWEVKSTFVIPDEPPSIREQLRELADSGRVDLILTTGGTGLSPRDSTPEATIAVADRLVPGFAEEMRRKGMEKTPRAILSRAVAAIRHKSLILNLPGSPKGAVESLDAVAALCRTPSPSSTARATISRNERQILTAPIGAAACDGESSTARVNRAKMQ